MGSAFDSSQLRYVAQVVADVAEREVLPQFLHLNAPQISRKTSAFDIVTDVDRRSESGITGALLDAFPGAAIVGEEAASADPSLLGSIELAPLCFVVDPLDGTMNFASGVPLFGIMVAVVQKGETVGAIIHDPICRRTATALRGEGAWETHADGERLAMKVADAVPLREMHAIIGTNFLPEPQRNVVARNLSRLGMSNWFRCAAHEYRLAAAGHMHLLFYNRLMPWDHAAGWLIHQEAGGYSAHFDGSAYRPFHTQGGLLCAPSKATWDVAREALMSE